MSNDHDIKVLNSLIETVIDSADGYTQASQESSRFSDVFRRRGAERQELTTRLQSVVTQLGGTPEDDGTMLAAAHRMFLGLRNSVSSSDTTVVDEVEAGEDHIKQKFEDAQRDAELSPAVRTEIDEAYLIVKAGHDEIRDLKHSLHATSA